MRQLTENEKLHISNLISNSIIHIQERQTYTDKKYIYDINLKDDKFIEYINIRISASNNLIEEISKIVNGKVIWNEHRDSFYIE